MVYIVCRKMDELLDELLDTSSNTDVMPLPDSSDVLSGADQKHHDRPAALALGVQAKHYGLVVRGKALTADQIDLLDEDEVEKLYARYETRLGAAMTRRWGKLSSRYTLRSHQGSS